MRFTDIELGVFIGFLVMMVSHAVIPRYWIAGLIGGTFCTVANVAHEVYISDLPIRPSDVAIWIPVLLITGFAVLTPLSFLVGLPFMLYRRKRKNTA